MTDLVVGKQYFFRWPKVGEALVRVMNFYRGGTEANVMQGEFRLLGKPPIKAGQVLTVDDGSGTWYEAKE